MARAQQNINLPRSDKAPQQAEFNHWRFCRLSAGTQSKPYSCNPHYAAINFLGTQESRKIVLRFRTSGCQYSAVFPIACLLFPRFLLLFLRSLDASKLSGARKFEVRVFDHAQNVAQRIENGGDTNPFADVLNICVFSCTER